MEHINKKQAIYVTVSIYLLAMCLNFPQGFPLVQPWLEFSSIFRFFFSLDEKETIQTWKNVMCRIDNVYCSQVHVRTRA